MLVNNQLGVLQMTSIQGPQYHMVPSEQHRLLIHVARAFGTILHYFLVHVLFSVVR